MTRKSEVSPVNWNIGIILTIILTSLHSFPLLFFYISTAISKVPFWFPASPPWFPAFCAFSTRFPALSGWVHALPFHPLHFHPCSLHYSHSVSQVPIPAFTDNLFSLWSLRIFFKKIVTLVQKWTLPCVTNT